MIEINPDEFRLIAKYIHDISGIYLESNKSYLIETRLSGILEETGCRSYGELCTRAKSDMTGSIANKIIGAISTNETLFFRDTGPFEVLQHKILPDLIDRKTLNASELLPIPIRIWSAACATGQELYSISIVLRELFLNPNRYTIKLLGTDISDEAIARASYGKFNRFEIERGLPPNILKKYFSPNGDGWKINDDIRAMILFKKLNLLKPFESLGKFDIIFCRNVAIYFNMEDRKKLFNKLANAMEPGGYLVIGSTESLTGICSRFEPKRHLRTIFYQRVE